MLRSHPRALPLVESLEARRLLTTWYVDNGLGGTGVVGTDNAATHGKSLATPFRTINYAAQQAVAGDSVLVRKGSYYEEVRPLNDGSAASPITYMPYNGEAVSIRGTTVVPSGGWTRVGSTNTYYAPWPGQYTSAVNNADQVFVNGQMLNLARWPDQGNSNLSVPNQATVDEIISTTLTGARAWSGGYEIRRIVFRDAAFTDGSQNWVGAKIWMNNGGSVNGQDETHDGNGVTGNVIAANPSTGTITVDIGSAAATGTNQPGNYQIGKGSRYFLFDPASLATAGLSHPGQWWRDDRGTASAADDRLYLRAFDNAAPSAKTVEVKQRDWAFNFDTGTGSTDRGRSHITVKDFDVFAASITTDHLAGTGAADGNGGNQRGNTTAAANHIVLDGLDLTYVSHFVDQAGDLQAQWAQSSGVILSGSDNVFKNGSVAWSAGSGIIVIGRRSKVLNSVVHDTNYTVTEGGGIGMGSTRGNARPSVDTEVAYNHVYNTGVDGIQFDGLWNSTGNKNDIRARVHHNVVHDTVLQSADSGGIKMVGSDGNWARVDHNVVYNTGGAQTATKYLFFGIYLDYTASTTGGYVVDHNVVYASPIGININNTHNVEVYHNTLIQPATVGRHSIGNDAGGTMSGVVVRNNLANRQPRGLSGTSAVLSHNVFNATETTTWFVAPTTAALADRDYRLVSNATTTGTGGAIDRGTTVPFPDDVGTPDLGAYPFGQPKWLAGPTTVVTPPPPPPPPGGNGVKIESGWELVGSGDFDANTTPDLVYRNATDGRNAIVLRDGSTSTPTEITRVTSTAWRIQAVGDYTGDRKPDLIWRNQTTGECDVWTMDGTTVVAMNRFALVRKLDWQIQTLADLDGDGRQDVIWRNFGTPATSGSRAGTNSVWYRAGDASSLKSFQFRALPFPKDVAWDIDGPLDADGDGDMDLILRNRTSGANVLWRMDDRTLVQTVALPAMTDTSYRVGTVADVNGDGKRDVVFRDTAGDRHLVWLLDGMTVKSQGTLS